MLALSFVDSRGGKEGYKFRHEVWANRARNQPSDHDHQVAPNSLSSVEHACACMCVMSKMLEQLRELIVEHLNLFWIVNLMG
jgi:hypothetical protein